MQQLLKGLLERIEPLFEKGGKLERLYPAYDAFATLAFVLPNRTRTGAHIRDAFDSKRMMVTVIFALIPPTLVGIFNIGYQRLLAEGISAPTLRHGGRFTFVPALVQGLIRFLPILIVTYAVGLGWEFLFAVSSPPRGERGLSGFGLPDRADRAAHHPLVAARGGHHLRGDHRQGGISAAPA